MLRYFKFYAVIMLETHVTIFATFPSRSIMDRISSIIAAPLPESLTLAPVAAETIDAVALVLASDGLGYPRHATLISS